MNTSKESTEEQDPEYITSEPTDTIQQQLYEQIARKNASDKIKVIIDREFSKEIDAKEKEILLIQDRLHTALKTLDLLKYVIITDYYNRKQCISEQKDDTKQTRIHPAIKELLGKTPRPSNVDTARPSTSKENFFFEQNISENDPEITDASTRSDFNNEINELSNNIDVDDKNCVKILNNGNRVEADSKTVNNKDDDNKGVESRKKSIFTNDIGGSDGPPKKIPRYIPPKSRLPDVPAPSRGIHHKVRRRIVVGNISKWIPPEWREDAASHKWTMYIRGSKEEDSNISEFVSKVRFFLHPSYRPNDVVEVTSPPFHLSRRGWGEFPLRVQLHFKNPTNKPMDIIHHLKLDRTYTGLQTLGSETIVDIWIKNCDFAQREVKDFINSKEDNDNSNDDLIIHNSNVNNSDSNRIEDYRKNIDKKYGHIFMDHDYTKVDNCEMDKNMENNITIVHSPLDGEMILNNKTNHDMTISEEEEDVEEEEEEEEEENHLVKSNSSQNNIENSINPSNFDNERNLSLIKNGIKNTQSIDSGKKLNTKIHDVLKSLDRNSEMLKPLEITIPMDFEPLKNLKEPQKLSKKVLLLNNDHKIITNFLNTNNNVKSTKSISLLKNPVNNSSNNNLTKKFNSFVNIQINPAKSVLLDATSSTPALQVAQPLFYNANYEQKYNINNTIINNSINRNGCKQKIIIGKNKIKLFTKKHEYEKSVQEIYDANINETERLIRFILRRISFITEHAKDVEYRKMHPYACRSNKEFLNYHIAKQRALEWFRAKEVLFYLKEKKVPDDKLWSPREIVLWCRLHGYTPIKTEIFNINPQAMKMSKSAGNSSNKQQDELDEDDIFNTCTEPIMLKDWIADFKSSNNVLTYLDDEVIDVDDIIDDNTDKIGKETCQNEAQNNLEIIQVPNSSLSTYTYVCETARKIGTIVGPEEIVPEVSDYTSGRIMTKVVECLMEDLLRLSLAKAWEKNNGNSPDTITLNDVRKVILEREEFDIFTNSGFGSSTIQ